MFCIATENEEKKLPIQRDEQIFTYLIILRYRCQSHKKVLRDH